MDDKTRAIAAPFAAAALVGALGACGTTTALAQEAADLSVADSLAAAAVVSEEPEAAELTEADASVEGSVEETEAAANDVEQGATESEFHEPSGDAEKSGTQVSGDAADAGENSSKAASQEEPAAVSPKAEEVSPTVPEAIDALAANNAAAVASLPAKGWTGDAYWDGSVDETGAAKVYTGYVVDSHDERGLQRYWIQNGYLFRGGLFDSLDGFYGYALKDGCVLRGTYTDEEGNIYLADNDGKLAGGSDGGWVVSSAYGHGLQRYWIDPTTHAAKEGFSGEGYAHYTTSNGYVLRGQEQTSDGAKRSANNDGLLAETGWLVTSGFGQGLQRYWLEDYKVATGELVHVSDGVWAYARPEGYVVRGSYAAGHLVYLADNDGVLAGGESGGWVVSASYGHGLQRYWIDKDSHAALTGFSSDGYKHYVTSAGYVLRGGLATSNGLLLADNDGRLMECYATSAGWFISGCMTGGAVQRYYLDEADGHLYARTGLFNADLGDGSGTQQFYGKPGVGYVSRNERIAINGKTYASNNDGVLKLALVRIYLDAGHGWNSSYDGAYDGGAEGCGYQEAQLTRELVQLIADAASRKYGLEVVTDNAVNYKQRNQDAYDKGCNYFVSIHFNSGGGTGSESYIHTLNAAPGSSQLQSIMHSKLIEGLGLRDRGKQEERFAVCGGKVPATLLEICFIDNASDMATYQARKNYLAECLAAGLYEYSTSL